MIIDYDDDDDGSTGKKKMFTGSYSLFHPSPAKKKYDGVNKQKYMQVEDRDRHRLHAVVAGFGASALEVSVMWPFEYRKVQAQFGRRPSRWVWPSKTMYRGLTPMLIGAPLQGMIRFGALDFFNEVYRNPETNRISPAGGLLAGLTAGVVEPLVLVTPMESVKTQLIQTGDPFVRGVCRITREQGLGGFYKGLVPTIARSTSNQALRFVFFNEYGNWLTTGRPSPQLTPRESLCGGMAAGAFGACCNMPVDTVKTHLQGVNGVQYRGVCHCAVALIRENGCGALWRGLSPRLYRVVPGQGIIFGAYQTIFQYLDCG